MSPYAQVPLAEVCTIVGGGTPRRSNEAYFGGPIPWATLTDVTSLDSLFVEQTKESITEVGLRESSARLIPAGTVLMTSRATIGYTAIATQPMATNQGFANLICSEYVLPEYLAYWLRHQRESLIQLAGGTTFRELPKSTLKGFHIPLPPLAEQRRIVSILSRAAKIERLRAQAQGRLQEFIPALFVKMFGDPATNPMGWPSFKLCDLSKYRPQYGVNARSITLVKGQPRYIRITDIKESGILSDKSVGVDFLSHDAYQLCEGDLLFARSGATVGKSYLYRPKDGLCVFAGYLIRFRLDTSKVHPEFAFRFTQTSAYARWLQNKQRIAAQPNVNAKEYGDLMIPTPPLAIQQRFATIARAAETIGERITHNSKFSSALLSSLICRLLEDAP